MRNILATFSKAILLKKETFINLPKLSKISTLEMEQIRLKNLLVRYDL